MGFFGPKKGCPGHFNGRWTSLDFYFDCLAKRIGEANPDAAEYDSFSIWKALPRIAS